MSERADRHERARSFDAVAAQYERHRPGYPPAALAWLARQLALGPGARVLDLGAGTGKLTRALLDLGVEAVAVEPGPPMLAQLREALPGVEALEGSAEAIPLAEGSVDAAVAGQAYHWFDPARAVPELHRVVRPGGGVGLVWNWWDIRDPLQLRIAELLAFPPAGTRAAHASLAEGGRFAELARTRVESTAETTPEALVARLATTSALITAEPGRRRELLDEIGRLAAAQGPRFPLPQLTHVYAYRRVS